MSSITLNEYRVLSAIATNCFAPTNYGIPETFEETGPVWSDSINDAGEPSEVEGKALSGVCGSLVAKGLVWSDAECIALTREGFEAWKHHRYNAGA